MSRDSITEQEYYQLKGLFVLAREHRDQVNRCVDSAEDILGRDPDKLGSHFADAIWGYPENDLDDVLRKMDVEVEDD